MLIQAVRVPILELSGALALRGGLRLLHPWNTDSRALGHAAAEAVPESPQHGWVGSGHYTRFLIPAQDLFSRNFTRRRFATADDEERLFLPRAVSPSRK